jgi:rhamnogalacturonyl hydrolase YesR
MTLQDSFQPIKTQMKEITARNQIVPTRLLTLALPLLLSLLGGGCMTDHPGRAAASGGITDAEIRDVVTRVAKHQIHPLADGDYPVVTNIDQARAAKPPVGIEWDYPWGVTLYGLERCSTTSSGGRMRWYRATDERGISASPRQRELLNEQIAPHQPVVNDPELNRFVVEHNQICARYYQWLAGLEKQIGDSRAVTNFTRRGPLRQLMSLGTLDSCGAMGNQLLVSMMLNPKQVTPEEKIVAARIADWVVNKQDRLPDGTLWRPKDQRGTVWPDDLYMGGVFLVRYGIYTGNRKYIDDTGSNIIHQAALEQDADGLWFHGYYLRTNSHAPYKWGRGNGWVMVTLVETLSAMPRNDPMRPQLIEILRNQIDGLKKLQAPDGMWRQILDHPDFWEETSCTAMFAYGIARAVNRGWIGPSNMETARRAFAGLSRNVTADGAVNETCEGTGIGTTLQFYMQRRRPPDDMHGRGPVILAGTEILSGAKK